jgi:hypothetical protein
MRKHVMMFSVVLAVGTPPAALATPSMESAAGVTARAAAQGAEAPETRLAIILQSKPTSKPKAPAPKKGR